MKLAEGIIRAPIHGSLIDALVTLIESLETIQGHRTELHCILGGERLRDDYAALLEVYLGQHCSF